MRWNYFGSSLAAFLTALVLILPDAKSQANEFTDTILSLLPSWPLNEPGDEIPGGLIDGWRGDLCKGKSGAYADFPSKGNKCEVDANLADTAIARMPPTRACPAYTKNVDPFDADDVCDDGDQTSYNGLLCASGDEAGCRAVAEAQDPASGRWFRSPHRRWVWFNRCFNTTEPFGIDKARPNDPVAQQAAQKRKFNDECAYGFSPDMNLGVLLYTLHSKDTGKYEHWLSWLDDNAKTTKLCKLNGDNVSDCITGIYWPRVCTDDLGHLNPGDTPGTEILGRYGGKCVLRPFDALDFSAVNHSLNIAPPGGLAKWDLDARSMINFAKGAVLPVPGGALIAATPPLVLTSSIEDKDFPIHLDAARVLIRMMIRNPSLHMDTLPDLPDPADIIKPENLGVSDGDDLVSIKAASRIIADRVPWDPFYQLLANGPTPAVRQLIVDHCPQPGDVSSKSDWIWEKATDGDGSKLKSMGWDCVFVSNLYNKMRVRKDLVDELFQKFLKYADVLGRALTDAQRALTLASAGTKVAEEAVAASKKVLDAAHSFVDHDYAELKKGLNNQLDQVESTIASINNQIAGIAADIAAKTAALPGTPDNISAIIGSRQVCILPRPWPFSGCAKYINNPISGLVPNPLKSALIKAISDLGHQRDALSDALNAPISAEHQLRIQVSDLDAKFQDLKSKIDSGALQAATDTAETGLNEQQKILALASKSVATLSNADKAVNDYVCVWKKDSKCSE